VWPTPDRRREQRPSLVGGEAAEVGAAAAEQLPATVAALLGVDRHPRHRQGLEVAPGRALGHLQLLGDLRGGDVPLALQDEEEGHQSICSHGAMIPSKPAKGCPVQPVMVTA